MSFFKCLVGLLAFFVMVQSATGQVVVEDMRIGQHADKTRLVLETTAAVKPDVFTLPNPPRVVLDFTTVTFKPDVRQVKQPRGGSLIKNMRQAIYQPGVRRLVLDVAQPVTPRVFQIPASGSMPHRVVIDLLPSGAGRQPAAQAAPTSTPRTQPPAPVVRKASPTRTDPVVIVLDPGHGGNDPGAVGLKKNYEKDVVLAVAKRLAKLLKDLPNVEVHLTRERDTYVQLADRVGLAQRRNADLFLSLHADAHRVRSVRGGSVYVLSQRASDKEAARLAQEANDSDQVAGVAMKDEPSEVRNILIDLAQRETMNKSAILGAAVLREMDKVINLRKDDVLFAGFKVLKAPEVPSILIEMGYMSNPEEERKLITSYHQNRIALALRDGIQTYINNFLR